ncbi:hypothetical protein BKA70DRAFT_1308784, partial [Coprinopsis sp. MPI-PUGE-AT-0042]
MRASTLSPLPLAKTPFPPPTTSSQLASSTSVASSGGTRPPPDLQGLCSGEPGNAQLYKPEQTEKPDALEEAKEYINTTVVQLFYTTNAAHDLHY